MIKYDKKPFGPLDVLTEMDSIKKLIGKNILYADDKEGLGCYGILMSIHPDRKYPYRIETCISRNGYAKWIVEHNYEVSNEQ